MKNKLIGEAGQGAKATKQKTLLSFLIPGTLLWTRESQIFMRTLCWVSRMAALAAGISIEARVRPTLEVMLTESPDHLIRRFDQESGLALICLEENPYS